MEYVLGAAPTHDIGHRPKLLAIFQTSWQTQKQVRSATNN